MRGSIPLAISAALAVTLVAAAPAQEVIENPSRPARPGADRVLELEETLRIVDDGRTFDFRLPWLIDAAPDGSIYVQDGVRLYRFGADGRFLGNLARIGQGPGEITEELTSLAVVDNADVIVSSGTANKAIVLRPDGRLLLDLPFKTKRFTRMVAADGDSLWMADLAGREQSAGATVLRQRLHRVDRKGTWTALEAEFVTRGALVTRTRGDRLVRSSRVLTTLIQSRPAGRLVFLTDSAEYLVRALDLDSGRYVRSFRRAYDRVPLAPGTDGTGLPKRENDVHGLLVRGNEVWVLTSTFDPKKGILTDVFDLEGKYLDRFWLPLTGSRTGDCFYARYFGMTIEGDALYAIEHDEDWLFSIARYRIPPSNPPLGQGRGSAAAKGE